MTPSASSSPPPPIPACFVSRLRSRVAKSFGGSACLVVLPRDHPVWVGGASSARGGSPTAGRRERNRDRGRRGRDRARGGAGLSRDEEVPLTALSPRPRRRWMTLARAGWDLGGPGFESGVEVPLSVRSFCEAGGRKRLLGFGGVAAGLSACNSVSLARKTCVPDSPPPQRQTPFKVRAV